MTIRTDVSIEWEVSPRVITVAAPSAEITIQDLVDTCRHHEQLLQNIDNDHLINAAGKEFLGGTTYVGITAILQNAVLAFEARGGPTWELCKISGGNLVAVDDVGADIDPRLPTAYTSIDRTASASATLQEQAALQYSSYNGGVTVDLTSSNTGIEYPIGTPQQPVNNFSDALSIISQQGLPGVLFVIGDATVAESEDYRGIIFVGESQTKSELNIDSAAQVDGCEFYDATVVGTLDGDCRIKNCTIGTLNYINGIIEQCLLEVGTITLGGSAEAHFLDCWSGVAGTSTPIIDMGGSGQELSLRNYNGGIKIVNKSGSDPISIDLNSGHVILNSDVTNGEVVIRGIGKLTDNSVGANVNIQDFVNPGTLAAAVWLHEDGVFLKDIEGGKWKIIGNQMIFYKDDNTTEVARFNLFDSAGSPTMTNVYERQRV